MADNLYNAIYNPDVLSCIANLSNDEVFTPPVIANKMLDLLPEELFSDPKTTFLDPACKSGVFLREIAKRLLKGLETQIPDLQERANHIFKKQLYGISITELTSHLSRRSVYCSKTANGNYSVADFDTIDGNIRFKPIEHTWVNGKCKFCGAPKQKYNRGDDLESHAYEFIHAAKPEEIFKMKFDVIISNPPYQLSDGGNGASAVPVYHTFIEQAEILNPHYMVFIVPARWLNGGRGLDEFRLHMLNSQKIRVLHDYLDSSEAFSGVEIKGGVLYFLWDRNYTGKCEVFTHNQSKVSHSCRPLLEKGAEIFIRSDEQVQTYHKVVSATKQFLGEWLNAGRYFGFHTKVNWIDGRKGEIQSSDGKIFYPVSKVPNQKQQVKVYIHGGECWISEKIIPRNRGRVKSYKVLIPRSGNPGFGNTIIARPKIAEPGTCSSNTYMVAIPNDRNMTKQESMNLCSYLTTKFVRFLVATKTSTQSTPPDAFEFVPMQDFSKPWTDAELYKKYKLTKDEIAFIESMIKPME